MNTPANETFRERLASGRPLIGTWIKTPSHIVTEVLSQTDLDVLCLDAEHAPFGRPDLDSCILAARSHTMPVLVRVRSRDAHEILDALDLGATGIVAPHIGTAEDAAALVRMAHFGPEGRGYAGSTRAARYTQRAMSEHLDQSRRNTTVIAQIEDAVALGNIDQIAAVPGIDCLFVGRADLAVSLGRPSIVDQVVMEAAELIVRAGAARDVPVGMFLSDFSEIPRWTEIGVRLFLLQSDQGFLLNGAASMIESFRRQL